MLNSCNGVTFNVEVEQIDWIQKFLSEILDQDRHRIFTMVIYMPYEREVTRLYERQPRVFEARLPLAIEWTIAKEWSTEAGTMAVSGIASYVVLLRDSILMLAVCGHPKFERRVRRGVSNAGHCINLFGSSFQPDETKASKACWERFATGNADHRARLKKEGTV